MADVPTCNECGFSVESVEHLRGVGLHGHVRTSKADADKQRAAGVAQTEAEEAARLAADAVVTPSTPGQGNKARS